MAILDVRNSLWITFLAILDQYRYFYFFWFFLQNGCRWPFWMSENQFRSHFYLFHIDTQLAIFFLNLTSAILDVRNSLSIAFLAISDRYATLILFGIFWQNGCQRPFWMSEIHFRSHFWPFQIDRPFWISEIHFRSQFWPFQIDTDLFFSGGHLGCLKITLDRISGHFRLIGHFGCPEIHFRWHFWPFQIHSELYLFFKFFWQNGHWRPFWMSANNFWSHFWPFQIDTQFFLNCFTKWPPPAILDGTTMSIIKLVRDIWMSNACVKFEERSLNPSKVIALITKLWHGGRGGCVADENIIFPIFGHPKWAPKKKNSVSIWNGQNCYRKWIWDIQNGRLFSNGQKCIKSDFRTSKMSAGGHFVKNVQKK